MNEVTFPPITDEDTRPSAPKRPRKTDPLRRILAALIIITALSLMITLLFAILQPSGEETPAPPAIALTLWDGEALREIETTAATVGELLEEQSITLGENDYINHPLEAPLSEGMALHIERARTVTITIDGQPLTLQTPLSNPQDILEAAGVTLGEQDRIWIDGTPADHAELLLWPVPATDIIIDRAVLVTVEDDGAQAAFYTTAATVGEALFEAGIDLYLADEVTPDLSAPVTNGIVVTIHRALPVTIVSDETTIETRVQPGTVADALQAAGITLTGLDYTEPREDETLFPGMIINIVHVTEDLTVEQETIPYETVYQADPNLELDTITTVQAGRPGILQITYRVRYENGQPAGREEAGRQVIQEPQNEIIAYGTNIVLRTIDTPEGPRQYWRHIRMYATSYHPAALGGDNITSIGETLRKGIIASHPDIIPYGTQLFVPGYGVGVMADTGGGLGFTRRWVDLGYSDDDFVSWSRWVDVYFLTPVPDEINYLLPE
ncbi:MAG: DUF348 domain-containing protein [Chloroflexi bacterium]|nr:MAG: DUF348 domain-containing protein [Chloroflexota bacterium]